MHESPQFSRSFAPADTFDQYARVKLLATGKIEACDVTDRGIGIAMRPAFTADVDNGMPIAVALDGPIRKGVAAEAFDPGDDVFSATDGKVGLSAATAHRLGVALQGAAEDDVIDYMAALFAAAVP